MEKNVLVWDSLWLGVLLLLALLTPAAKPEHKVEGGLLLNVVIGKRAAVFELLAGEDKSLLIRWDSFFILDLGLHILDRVGRFDIEGNSLTREGFYENLHLYRTNVNKSNKN